MREFINATSRKEGMRSSKKARKAYALAIVSLIINAIIIVYIILTK